MQHIVTSFRPDPFVTRYSALQGTWVALRHDTNSPDPAPLYPLFLLPYCRYVLLREQGTRSRSRSGEVQPRCTTLGNPQKQRWTRSASYYKTIGTTQGPHATHNFCSNPPSDSETQFPFKLHAGSCPQRLWPLHLRVITWLPTPLTTSPISPSPVPSTPTDTSEQTIRNSTSSNGIRNISPAHDTSSTMRSIRCLCRPSPPLSTFIFLFKDSLFPYRVHLHPAHRHRALLRVAVNPSDSHRLRHPARIPRQPSLSSPSSAGWWRLGWTFQGYFMGFSVTTGRPA